MEPDRIEVLYRLPAAFRVNENGVFVACCPPLGIFSQGKTEGEAKRRLHSAATLYIKACHRRGILSRLMQERGGTVVDPGEQSELGKLPTGPFIAVLKPLAKDATPYKLDVALDFLVAKEALTAMRATG